MSCDMQRPFRCSHRTEWFHVSRIPPLTAAVIATSCGQVDFGNFSFATLAECYIKADVLHNKSNFTESDVQPRDWTLWKDSFDWRKVKRRAGVRHKTSNSFESSLVTWREPKIWHKRLDLLTGLTQGAVMIALSQLVPNELFLYVCHDLDK